MNRYTATTIVLVIAAWALGALEGSVVYRRHDSPSPVRFAPGRYLIEPSDQTEDEPAWIVNYTSAWSVSPLPPRPTP